MKKLSIFLFTAILLCPVHLLFAQKVNVIGPVRIIVSDMDRSLNFYTKVLPFEKISDEELSGESFEKLLQLFGLRMRIVILKLGDEQIELVDYLTAGGRSIAEDAKANDLSFQHIAIVVSNMEQAYKHLRKYNVVHVSTGPQTLPASIPEAAGVKAFYFQDPDRHNLELIYFPQGKGQEKWQRKTGKIFLGIDHTAFGVSNTEKSLGFYRDMLGIERKGDSYNKGTEQQHLNNVEGAVLHITGLRTNVGPGLEFLEYLVPGSGKQYPPDTRADDIWNLETTLFTDDASKLYAECRKSNCNLVSESVVEWQAGNHKNKGFIVRDPDGHSMLIVEKINDETARRKQ